MQLLSLFSLLALSIAVFANNFDENGILCESNLTYATMDLVVVVEVTDATAGDKYGVMGSLLTYLSTLPITNSDTGIRLALVTYGKTAVTSYNFNTIQSLYAFKNALVQAFDNTPSTGSGDIQVGLSTAYTYIQNTPSSNVPAILLFATTYDDSGVNDPNATATDIKGNNIKIMTLTYTPYLGVSSPKIALLASPGLAFDARFATPNVTNKAFAAMNCVCQPGWNQLFVNDNYYSECFKVAGGLANRIGAVLEPGAIFVTLQSRNRKDYIEANVVKDDVPYLTGLSRFQKDGWSWDTYDNQPPIPYNEYSLPFVTPPSNNAQYGYIRLNGNGLKPVLDSDDGFNSMHYVSAKRASDYTKQH